MILNFTCYALIPYTYANAMYKDTIITAALVEMKQRKKRNKQTAHGSHIFERFTPLSIEMTTCRYYTIKWNSVCLFLFSNLILLPYCFLLHTYIHSHIVSFCFVLLETPTIIIFWCWFSDLIETKIQTILFDTFYAVILWWIRAAHFFAVAFYAGFFFVSV